MLILLLRRELLLLARKKSELLNPIVFYLIIVSLFPLGLTPDTNRLTEIASGVIWVGVLLSLLLSFDLLYRDDFDDGSLVQMIVLGVTPTTLVLAKTIAHWLLVAVPIVMLSPLLAILLYLPAESYWALLLSLLLGTPTLCLLGAIGIALTIGLKRGGALLSLLVLPLFVPILIIGSMAVMSANTGQSYWAPLLLLLAALILSASLAPWAAGAALKLAVSE